MKRMKQDVEKLSYPFILDADPVIPMKDWLKIILINVFSVLLLTSNYIDKFVKTILNFIPAFSIQGVSDLYNPSISSIMAQISSGIIFLSLNIFILSSIVGADWKQLFRRITLKDLVIGFIFLIATFFVASISGNMASILFGSEKNPAMSISIHHNGAWRIFFIGRIEHIFQLLGEEFISILPFLATIQLFSQFKWKRSNSIFWALIISSLLFTLFHLSTYAYNFGFVIVSLFFTRVLFTSVYIKTKNIWMSFIVHYIFDLIPFTLSFFFI